MKADDYRRILRNTWQWILLSTLIGGLVGFAIASIQPKVFTASSQSFVAISSSDPTNANITTGSTFISQRIDSYGQLVSSPQVLQPVIDELHLNETVQTLKPKVKASSPAQTVLIDVSVDYDQLGVYASG